MTYIIENKIQAGTVLPKELEIASMLGVSRSVTREALIGLRNSGILESVKKKGTILKKADPSKSLATCLPFLCMDKSGTNDIMLFRYILELGAVEIAASRRSEEDISLLDEIVDSYRKQIGKKFSLAQSKHADSSFHIAILKCSHSELIYKMSKVIINFFNEVYTSKEKVNTDIEAILEEHMKIFTAIKEKDPEKARFFMKQHLGKGLNL